jgi:hypothetical protein
MKTEFGISLGPTEINCNEDVYVRLTAQGRECVKSHFENMDLPSDIKKENFVSYTQADDEGWSKFQLWNLMKIFGSLMYMGSVTQPFEHNVVRIGKKEEKTVQIISD